MFFLNIDIKAMDVFLFFAPLIMGFYFYAKSYKSQIDRDKLILSVLSLISFIIWSYYLFDFFYRLFNRPLY